MIAAVTRKVRQVAADPTLRRWLAGRALGRCQTPAPFTVHVPPYAADLLPLSGETPDPVNAFSTLNTGLPTGPLTLNLPGGSMIVSPDAVDDTFRKSHSDIETELSLHRFQWVCAAGDDVDPSWVNAIWRAWCEAYATPDDGWAWHPYTAAERATNIIRFARRFGLPGDADRTLRILASHGPVIASRLEYFGEHHTSNHLANNGRGLFILGAELGMPKCAALGEAILLNEAARIFSPGGTLREGSSHYHALLTSHYLECAALAADYEMSSAPVLARTATNAQKALGQMMLPGGLPLVGDISPDLAPDILLQRLGLSAEPDTDITQDGWTRYQYGDWSGLWHCAPDGWSHMPGHGHQDCGGFELHFGKERVFVDPGRGAYGEDGDAALYRSAEVHNTLMLNGLDPYPANKPYYDDAFRLRECGGPPLITTTENMVSVFHGGYTRLGAAGMVQREWKFNDHGFTLTDTVDGRDAHRVTRALVSPLPASVVEGAVLLSGATNSYRVTAEVEPTIEPVTIWQAYGVGEQGARLVFDTHSRLPWSGHVKVEATR